MTKLRATKRRMSQLPGPVVIGRKMVGLDLDFVPTVAQEMRLSTSAQMRRLLMDLGQATIPILLVEHPDLHPVTRAQLTWLADALIAIGMGDDANRALGLKRKNRFGPRENFAAAEHVQDLREQGLPEVVALDVVSRMRANGRGGYSMLPPEAEDNSGPRLEKRLDRFRRDLKLLAKK